MHYNNPYKSVIFKFFKFFTAPCRVSLHPTKKLSFDMLVSQSSNTCLQKPQEGITPSREMFFFFICFACCPPFLILGKIFANLQLLLYIFLSEKPLNAPFSFS